ncbi:hypothetical protein FB45DRAFT_874678 [Roridomyces roridus]|uniref:Uncharacterized protein n=1 Tax=Roridomyces roridus TaxID=1738132 RepID=A0AAD7B8P3_9AGAR|nr:hypothetical protein FB45DRAFT_874678 [Roridomyces roridus]
MFRLLVNGLRPHPRPEFPRFKFNMTEHVYHLEDRYNVSYRPQPGTILPDGWSCDWKSWKYNDLDIYQDNLQDSFGITAWIEPLAHQVRSSKFVFHAGGEYYWHFPAEILDLKRFTGTFESHDDFVQRFEEEMENGTWVKVPFVQRPPGLLTLEEIRAHPEVLRFGLAKGRLSEIIDEIHKKRDR